jgi:hypothetical protein
MIDFTVGILVGLVIGSFFPSISQKVKKLCNNLSHDCDDDKK